MKLVTNPMTRTKNKGFTLIELLIVIAIIGLLATLAIVSLTSAQQRARDTKRVADVKAMQTAMELYWNENAEYPAVVAGGSPTTWTSLQTDLATFVSALPVDPEHPTQLYFYGVASDATADEYLQEYVVGATIENDQHQGLAQDVDGTPGTVPADYNSVTANDGVVGATAVSCADPIYCLSGVATP